MPTFLLRFLNALFGGRYFALLDRLNLFPVDKKEQALELLKRRLASGDINEAEYRHLRRKIENS